MRSLLVAVLALAGGLTLMLAPTLARDLGQWSGTDAKTREWYARQMQPDNPAVSCCGEADAYWADQFEQSGDQWVAIVTDERDDAPLMRPHIPVGTRIVVPQEKVKLGAGDPNPTGHGIIFLSYGNHAVYCFLPPAGL